MSEQQQQSDHHVSGLPVIKTFMVNGHEVRVRYRGTWSELCAAYAKSLQQDWARLRASYPTDQSEKQVADRFKSNNLLDLNIGTSALYLLAAPSTPEAARSEAIERAQAGEIIT